MRDAVLSARLNRLAFVAAYPGLVSMVLLEGALEGAIVMQVVYSCGAGGLHRGEGLRIKHSDGGRDAASVCGRHGRLVVASWAWIRHCR